MICAFHFISGPTRATRTRLSKVTKEKNTTPVVGSIDSEVLQFRAQFDQRSPLDQLVRDGAQKMLQAAIEEEVDEFWPSTNLAAMKQAIAWLCVMAIFPQERL